MIQTILNWIQPLTVLIFVLAAILCFITRDYRVGTINFCISITNFMIFYGGLIFK